MKHAYVVAAVAFLVGACNQKSPVVPTPPTVPGPQLPGRPSVTPHPTETITVGETVRSAVASDDVRCDTADPTKEELDAPCKTFQFTSPKTGIFMANISWAGKDIFLELLTPSYGACCRSPLYLGFGVTAGETYILSVGFHGKSGAGPKETAPFELTTSVTP